MSFFNECKEKFKDFNKIERFLNDFCSCEAICVETRRMVCRTSKLQTLQKATKRFYFFMESLILAQSERWRRA